MEAAKWPFKTLFETTPRTASKPKHIWRHHTKLHIMKITKLIDAMHIQNKDKRIRINTTQLPKIAALVQPTSDPNSHA